MRTCSTHELVLNSPTYNQHIGNTNGEPSSYSAESKSGSLSQQIEARQSTGAPNEDIVQNHLT